MGIPLVLGRECWIFPGFILQDGCPSCGVQAEWDTSGQVMVSLSRLFEDGEGEAVEFKDQLPEGQEGNTSV